MQTKSHSPEQKSGKGESILIEYLMILILLSDMAILSSNHDILIRNQGNVSLIEIVKAESKSGKRIHGHGNILITNQVKADAKQNVKSDLKSEKSNGDAMDDSDYKSENGNVWVRYGVPIGLLLVLICGLLIGIENEIEEKKKF